MPRATRKTVPRRRRMARNAGVATASPASSLSSLSISPASSYATSSGTRMNTHILLAITFLALGATSTNAHPLSVGDKAGLAGTFSETLLRFVKGNSTPVDGQTLVLNRPDTPDLGTKQELVLNQPATAGIAAVADDEALKTPLGSRFHIPPLPSLLFNKDSDHPTDIHLPYLPSLTEMKLPETDIPGATLAMGIARVLESMRGMFIEVAQDQADVLVGEALRLENGEGGERVLFGDAKVPDIVNQPPANVSEMVNSELATAGPEELAVPGAFDPQASLPEEPQPSRAPLEEIGARIDPFAALAISASLSALVVVLVIVGRNMLLQVRERKTHDEDLEAQDADAKLLDEEEVNEKVGLVDPARGKILVDVDVDDEDEKRDEEMRKAREALHLLVEVANAAAPTASALPALGFSSRPITPIPVNPTIRNLTATTSRPESPVPRPDPKSATPLRDAVEKLRSAAGTPVPGGQVNLCVPRQHHGHHKEGYDDTDDSDEENSRVWRSANASPVPPFPASSSANGSDEDEDEDEEFADAPDPELAVIPMHTADNEVKPKRMPLPSAELTYAALDLALQLPGTEWIFQFLVIFVSWFGMFLGPTTTGRRR